jgi:hypothetical protein
MKLRVGGRDGLMTIRISRRMTRYLRGYNLLLQTRSCRALVKSWILSNAGLDSFYSYCGGILGLVCSNVVGWEAFLVVIR